MKTTLFALFLSASVALSATYPVSISTTNGRAFGTTDVSSLVGKITTGNVTNELGSRVAYLSDTNGIGGGVTPTNTAIVGQVLHASSAGGASKWDYVNQALTNSNPVVPDFNLPVNYWQTNAAFLFLAPANVETTGKKLQVTDCIVTNSTAAAVAVTFPGSVHLTGTAFLTNVTKFHWSQFAGLWTNCSCEPVW